MTDEECRMKDPQRGFCGPGGTCVECKTSLSCVSATQPICVANACVRCTRDQQCRDKEGADPGVCMSHEDGRCLTDPDTIYVRNNVLCPGNGRVTTPFCRPLDAMAALTVARKVVVIRGPDAVSGWSLMGLPAGVDRVTVVGQMGARVDGGGEPGVHVRGGARSYIRDLVFAGGGNVGVIADTGAEITLARCVVHDNAKGGILVDGAAFDISNTLVSQNGPGTYGSGVSWGGVLLQSAPVGRPARFAHNTVVDNMVMGLWCDGTYAVTGSIVSGSPLDPYMCSVAPCCAPGDPMLTSDYRLAPGSPCVDRVAPAAAPSDDLDGNPRPSPANGLSDCGAYELAR
jgi:hypothetical protein